ncbi:MAG: hypothetical protein ACHQAY_01620 [Hyphomicrobiales bacterium]
MRATSLLAIVALAAGALGTAPADAASHRYRYRAPLRPPLIVRVAPRSFLDPGPVVPVGSQSSYVYVSQYPYFPPYAAYINHYGEPPLPGFGDGGRPLFEHLDFGPLSGP